MGGVTKKQMELKRFKFYVSQYISKGLAEQFAIPVNIRTEENPMLDNIVLHVVQGIMGETLQKELVEYPADWWQAFKARWFPGWLRRRYPVKMRIVELEAAALYPKVSMPEWEHRVKVMRYEYDQCKYEGEDAD